MQKKLISAAIASALAIPGVAMADITSNSGITVYGKFHASWDYVDADVPGGTSADDSDDNTAVFRNSRLGFKGSEDLGSGLNAIWQIETELDNGEDENAVQLRNTFIGLQGDNWGKIILGKHDTPYKTATAKLDIFSDTIADYNNIIGAHTSLDEGEDGVDDSSITTAQTFNLRAPQLVTYETPNFNGFSAQLARVSIQENEDSGDEETESWSAMAMYDQGPFFASLAYEVHSGDGTAWNDNGTDDIADDSLGNANNAEIDAWKVGLGYTFGNSTFGLVYEDISHDDNDIDRYIGRDAWWGAFSHQFGANVLKLSYGRADNSDDTEDGKNGADTWAIGIDHNFSKRTKVYAIYTDIDNDANGTYDLYSAQNSEAYSSDGGVDGDAFSVGIIHNF